ncbi:hypothetical protein ACFFUT_09610 [Pseudohalocynthiibacter aestuariivivens]|uniref:Uncharacterized protein n=1 Tax=Pseudohalocynthiibacter aestuariivivens TaxID=1591409 RepID=A0ABV5JH76_9RHOB|nr:hypothetical protein [Pseudohalocynthiibacter aestuariivivens]MBS9719045.1 hypothetical protein [Pseudohalocynthiibacter aestuariivivens]
MAATYKELIAKSRELHASGDIDGARRVAEIAVSRREPERSFGRTIYENVIGSGEADTPGEKVGQAINDAGKSFFAGVGRGVTGLLDLPGNIVSGAGNYAIDKAEGAYEATTGRESPAFDGARYAIDRFPMGDGSAARDISERVTDDAVNYRGESRGSRIAGTIGEFLPGAAALGGTNALLPYAVAPGVASELAGEATEGKTLPENIPLVGGKDAEPFARIAAAIAAPAAYNVGTNAIRSAVTPHPTDPARIAAAQRLESEGVQLTAGQKTGNRNLSRSYGRGFFERSTRSKTHLRTRQAGFVSRQGQPPGGENRSLAHELLLDKSSLV